MTTRPRPPPRGRSSDLRPPASSRGPSSSSVQSSMLCIHIICLYPTPLCVLCVMLYFSSLYPYILTISSPCIRTPPPPHHPVEVPDVYSDEIKALLQSLPEGVPPLYSGSAREKREKHMELIDSYRQAIITSFNTLKEGCEILDAKMKDNQAIDDSIRRIDNQREEVSRSIATTRSSISKLEQKIPELRMERSKLEVMVLETKLNLLQRSSDKVDQEYVDIVTCSCQGDISGLCIVDCGSIRAYLSLINRIAFPLDNVIDVLTHLRIYTHLYCLFFSPSPHHSTLFYFTLLN